MDNNQYNLEYDNPNYGNNIYDNNIYDNNYGNNNTPDLKPKKGSGAVSGVFKGLAIVIVVAAIRVGIKGLLFPKSNTTPTNKYKITTEHFSPTIDTSSTIQIPTEEITAETINPDKTTDNREKKNGYDPETNTQNEHYGYIFNTPTYWGSPTSNADNNSVYYYAETGSSVAVMSITPTDEKVTDEEFDANKTNFKEAIVDALQANSSVYQNVKLTNSGDATIMGNSALTFDISFYFPTLSVNANGRFYIINDYENGRVLSIGFQQTDNAAFDYLDDFDKIVYDLKKAN